MYYGQNIPVQEIDWLCNRPWVALVLLPANNSPELAGSDMYRYAWYWLETELAGKNVKLSGAAVAEWLSAWLAEQEVWGSIPCLATWISEIGNLLLPSRDMAEISLKRRKSSIQPTNVKLAEEDFFMPDDMTMDFLQGPILKILMYVLGKYHTCIR